MTENSHPYILETTVTVESRTLIFAESLPDAARLQEERLEETMAHLVETAHLPKDGEPGSEHLIFSFDVRPAMGYEVAGSARLLPTIPTLEVEDVCSCDHAAEDED